MSTDPPLRAALYLRISEDPDDERAGVERQRADCRAYAQRQGWTVVDTFEDNDTSAYRAKRRNEYQRLIADVKAHRFDVVVGYHSSRWHRDVMEYLAFVQLCKDNGVGWHTAMEGEIRFDSATDEATGLMRAVFNQLESALKSERIRRAHRQIAEDGRFHGGMRPFGFEADGVTIREGEAAEIRRCADAVIRGQSLRSLALELNERGVRTVTGRRWTSSRLRSVLLAPRLAGLREHQGKEHPACWKPIVSAETRKAVADVLEDPKRRSGGGGRRRGPTPTALGTHLYVCGCCMQPRLRLGRTAASAPRYRCANADKSNGGHVTRVADLLDAYVEGALLAKISEPGVIEALCNVVDSDDADLAALRSERATIRPRLNKAAMRYEADEIDDEQLSIISKGLRARDAEIAAILTAANMRSPLDVLLGEDNIEKAWDEILTMGQKRAILAEVLIVTVLPTNRVGRAKDGSYFDQDAVRIELSERARSAVMI